MAGLWFRCFTPCEYGFPFPVSVRFLGKTGMGLFLVVVYFLQSNLVARISERKNKSPYFSFLLSSSGRYASVKAIETESRQDDRQWLTYWVLYSMITLCEMTFSKIIEW